MAAFRGNKVEAVTGIGTTTGKQKCERKQERVHSREGEEMVVKRRTPHLKQRIILDLML